MGENEDRLERIRRANIAYKGAYGKDFRADIADAIENASPAGAMKWKGTVDSKDSLPVAGNRAGDVYHANDDGIEYAWNGTEWEPLGNNEDSKDIPVHVNYTVYAHYEDPSNLLPSIMGALKDMTYDEYARYGDRDKPFAVGFSRDIDGPSYADLPKKGNAALIADIDIVEGTLDSHAGDSAIVTGIECREISNTANTYSGVAERVFIGTFSTRDVFDLFGGYSQDNQRSVTEYRLTIPVYTVVLAIRDHDGKVSAACAVYPNATVNDALRVIRYITWGALNVTASDGRPLFSNDASLKGYGDDVSLAGCLMWLSDLDGALVDETGGSYSTVYLGDNNQHVLLNPKFLDATYYRIDKENGGKATPEKISDLIENIENRLKNLEAGPGKSLTLGSTTITEDQLKKLIAMIPAS